MASLNERWREGNERLARGDVGVWWRRRRRVCADVQHDADGQMLTCSAHSSGGMASTRGGGIPTIFISVCLISFTIACHARRAFYIPARANIRENIAKSIMSPALPRHRAPSSCLHNKKPACPAIKAASYFIYLARGSDGGAADRLAR